MARTTALGSQISADANVFAPWPEKHALLLDSRTPPVHVLALSESSSASHKIHLDVYERLSSCTSILHDM